MPASLVYFDKPQTSEMICLNAYVAALLTKDYIL